MSLNTILERPINQKTRDALLYVADVAEENGSVQISWVLRKLAGSVQFFITETNWQIPGDRAHLRPLEMILKITLRGNEIRETTPPIYER